MRVATLEDAEYLSKRLRQCDVDEVKASHNLTPYVALKLGIQNSNLPLAVILDEKPVAIFGVVPTEYFGSIWLLGSDELKDVSLSFLRQCKGVVHLFNKQFPLLANCCSANNELHIKWLRWCGFKFIKLHEEYGYEKKPFYEFVRLNV